MPGGFLLRTVPPAESPPRERHQGLGEDFCSLCRGFSTLRPGLGRAGLEQSDGFWGIQACGFAKEQRARDGGRGGGQ